VPSASRLILTRCWREKISSTTLLSKNWKLVSSQARARSANRYIPISNPSSWKVVTTPTIMPPQRFVTVFLLTSYIMRKPKTTVGMDFQGFILQSASGKAPCLEKLMWTYSCLEVSVFDIFVLILIAKLIY
jgi:hypothetical protein